MYFKTTYDQQFDDLYMHLKAKYPDKLFDLDGIGKQLDMSDFSKNFFSSDVNADASIDANANVDDISVIAYNSELPKPFFRLNSYYVLWNELRKEHGLEVANDIVEKNLTGDIYINDFHGVGGGLPYSYYGKTVLAVKVNDEWIYTTFEDLYNNLVKDYSDLYELKVDDVIPLERMAQKSAENLVNGIEKSKEIPFERVLYALGIRYVGETVAKKLAKHYKNIDAIRNASLMDLILVDEIGEKIAQSVIEFFENPENIRIIERLKQFGVQFEIIEKHNPNATDKLAGKIFVVSGVFEIYSRDELKKAIEDNGGKVGSSISAKTDTNGLSIVSNNSLVLDWSNFGAKKPKYDQGVYW